MSAAATWLHPIQRPIPPRAVRNAKPVELDGQPYRNLQHAANAAGLSRYRLMKLIARGARARWL